MGTTERNRYLMGLIAVAAAMIGLLILPFAGFTEKTTYWIGFEVAGLGTWSDGLNLFAYPDTLFYVSMLLLVGAVALIGPLQLLWDAYRNSEQPPGERLHRASAIAAVVAVGALVLLLATMFVLLPLVEERTIWDVEVGGFLSDWWPGFGAFVVIGGAGLAYWALRTAANTRQPGPPPPPTE